MTPTETNRQLRWLMILRLVTVTTLLVSAFAINLLILPSGSLQSLFTLAAFAYGMVLIYAALDRWLRNKRAFIYIQLSGDALVVTGFVGITGGLDSPMSFLYLLPVCVASLMLYRSGALILSTVCWVMYTVLIIVGPLWMSFGQPIQMWIERDPGRVGYSLVVHLVGMVAVALLSSYLSERLRVQGHELAERSGTVARLQALNKNIIESINSGLVTTDLDGRINFINRGGCQITEFSQEEVEGLSIESLFDLAPDFVASTRRELLAQRRFRFEKNFEAKSGTIYLGVAVSNLYDSLGQPLGYIFIFQDLTEIQQLEQEMRLKERMAALGEMAAGMAHELRNPLAAISGSVQYLKGDLSPAGETLELMDIILRESRRLDQTIRDFLTFTRPAMFNAISSDLVKLIEDSIKLLRKSREFRLDHRIQTRYAEPRMFCDVDTNRMTQVFWNLASNALKAMPDGGQLTIEVAPDETGENVEICFADDGKGMSKEERLRYFQPFSSSFDEGTGLGAAIVYRLVEEHRGRITLESRRGGGTEVRIIIPKRCENLEPALAPLTAAGAGGG